MGNNHEFFIGKQLGRVLIYVIVVLVAGGLYPATHRSCVIGHGRLA